MPSATHEDLILIDELNVALGSGTDEAAIEDWRTKVEKLEASLSLNKRTTKQDMAALQRLKDQISLATLTIREGGKLDTHLARLALHQIQQSIERRTAGPDGWPLWER